MAHSGFEDRTLGDLLEEYSTQRSATVAFFAGLPEAATGAARSMDTRLACAASRFTSQDTSCTLSGLSGSATCPS